MDAAVDLEKSPAQDFGTAKEFDNRAALDSRGVARSAAHEAAPMVWAAQRLPAR